jgi:aerobic carbon-monoxide dehydrogenase medium subunit
MGQTKLKQRPRKGFLKAPRFDYLRARSLQEVLDTLAAHGGAAKVLAGGQSLIPTLAMRLSEPALLIDINGIDEMRGIEPIGEGLRLGALTRHAELEVSPLVRERVPLLAAAAPHIAHPAIRNRGTLGGSLAFADPAAELPAAAVALDVVIVAAGPRGRRRIAARDFFRGLYETALQSDEIIVAVEVPPKPPGTRAAFLELARRRGDYAMVGLAAMARVAGEAIEAATLVFFGVGTGPVLARAASQALAGSPLAARIRAAQEALDTDLDPPADQHGDAAVKRHLARVLLGRAVTALLEENP